MDRTPSFRLVHPLLAVLIVTLVFTPARAQAPVPGLTVTALGGGSIDGNLTEGLQVNTKLEPGWIAGLQVEHYFGSGLLGVRLDGLYTVRTVEDGTGKFDVFGLGLGGVLRPRILTEMESIQPIGVVSVGATAYSAVPGSPTFGGGNFGPDPVTRFNLTASVGVDVTLMPQLGLRLEVGDRVTFPSLGDSPPADGFPTAHTAIFMAGLQYRLGVTAPHALGDRPEPPQDAVRPEPEPRPEPAPAVEEEAEPVPAPEPAPADTMVADTSGEDAAGVSDGEAAAFTVQVGTYLTPATARRWGERLSAQGIPVWYLDRSLGGTDVTRIRAGAAATEAALGPLAELIRTEFGWDVAVEPIGADEPVPAGAVARTREVVEPR